MDLVRQAANILELSEYELFRRAYRQWHGCEPSEAALGRAYGRHFQGGGTPHWVRDYARAIILEFEREQPCAWLRGRWWFLCPAAPGRPGPAGMALEA